MEAHDDVEKPALVRPWWEERKEMNTTAREEGLIAEFVWLAYLLGEQGGWFRLSSICCFIVAKSIVTWVVNNTGIDLLLRIAGEGTIAMRFIRWIYYN